MNVKYYLNVQAYSGQYTTRTCDPFDVNEVRYQLRQLTLFLYNL